MTLTRFNIVFSEVNQNEIKYFTYLFRDISGRILQGFSKKLDFRKAKNVCNEYHYNLTDLSYEQSTVLYTREATGLLLTQLRTGFSHSVLAILFSLTEIQVS